MGQTISTNDDGEKIITLPDGSWRYYDEDAMNDEKPSNISTGKYSQELEDKARLLARERVNNANQEVSSLELKAKDAKRKRILLEENLQKASTNLNTSEKDLIKLRTKYEHAKNTELSCIADLKIAKQNVKQLEKMVFMDIEKRNRLLAKMNINDQLVLVEETEQPYGEVKKRGINPKREKEFNSNNSAFASYDKNDDVILNPPPKECKIAFDGVDEFNNKKRKDVEKQLLFTHTNDKMRTYFKGREYITCYGNLTSISGGYRYLWLEFHIASELAQREFGSIEERSVLHIKFIDGTSVKLVNKKTDLGKVNTLKRSTIYKGQYQIGASAEKQLVKKEIDKIRVVWSTGYEDYEAYEVDFFIDQFNCLYSE